MQWFIAALAFGSLVNVELARGEVIAPRAGVLSRHATSSAAKAPSAAAREPRASRCQTDGSGLSGIVFAHGRPIEPKSEVRVEKMFVTTGARVHRGDRIARLRGRGTFEVVAPFTGTVVDTCVAAGERSGPGRPLIRLAPPSQPLAVRTIPSIR